MDTTKISLSTPDKLITLAKSIKDAFLGESPARIASRMAIWSSMQKKGLHTDKLEHWKYTNFNRLLRGKSFQALMSVESEMPDHSINLPAIDAWFWVCKDGYFSDTLSQLEGLPKGVTLCSINERRDTEQKEAKKPSKNSQEHSLSLLNKALRTDGLYLKVAKDVQLKKPLYILYLSTENTIPTCLNYANIVHLEKGARATIIEKNHTLGARMHLLNTQTNITLDLGANLDYTAISDPNALNYCVQNLNVTQHQDSHFQHFSLLLDKHVARTSISIDLAGEGARCALNGFYFTKDKEHVDHHLCVNHLASHTKSSQFYKGVADDASQAVFNGKVVVHKGITKVDASQTNRNLLLSTKAEIDTKPELEIYADDVKCAHGATVGQLDNVALFYLESRGIDPATARTILTRAFGAEIYAKIKHEALKKEVQSIAELALAHHFAKRTPTLESEAHD